MKKCFAMVVSVLWVTVSMSMAQNPVPYQDTYEGYSAGSNLVGTVWQGASGAMAVVTNGTPTEPTVGYPVPAAAHTKVMAFSDGPMTNVFDGTTSNLTVVALDTMIKPMFAERPEGSTMIAVSNSQVSMYIGTNGLVNLWHGTGNGWGAPSGLQWSEFPQATLSSGAWVRLTVTMKYMPGEFGTVVMAKLAVNGESLTNGLAWSDASQVDLAPDGGAWFKAAKWDSDARLHSIVLSGSGMLDDMVVATNEMTYSVMVATNGTPIAWMQEQGLTTNVTYPTWDDVALGDKDEDGAPTWAEHIAGTKPDDATSKLVIVSATISNGAPILKWIGTTNAMHPYTVQWSSNLMSISAWTTITNNLVRSEGTNQVTLPVPAVTPAFLKVKVE